MLSFGKASKQTHTKNICQLKSHQLTYLSRWNSHHWRDKKICCPDVTKGDGLFLKGQIPQYDRVDNHSWDMDKLFFFIKLKYCFYYQMINTLKLSNLLFNKILIKQFFLHFMIWLYSTLIQMGHSKITRILSHKTKKKSRKCIYNECKNLA